MSDYKSNRNSLRRGFIPERPKPLSDEQVEGLKKMGFTDAQIKVTREKYQKSVNRWVTLYGNNKGGARRRTHRRRGRRSTRRHSRR